MMAYRESIVFCELGLSFLCRFLVRLCLVQSGGRLERGVWRLRFVQRSCEFTEIDGLTVNRGILKLSMVSMAFLSCSLGWLILVLRYSKCPCTIGTLSSFQTPLLQIESVLE